MKRGPLIIVFLISLVGFSCSPICKDECTDESLMDDIIDIMDVCHYYEEHPEEVCEECLKMIISNIIDYRTSTSIFYTHSSVYFIKIKALESITGVSAEGIHFLDKPDAIVIDKYLKWYKENTDIDVSNLCLVYSGLKMDNPFNFLKNYDKVDWPEGWNSCQK